MEISYKSKNKINFIHSSHMACSLRNELYRRDQVRETKLKVKYIDMSSCNSLIF